MSSKIRVTDGTFERVVYVSSKDDAVCAVSEFAKGYKVAAEDVDWEWVGYTHEFCECCGASCPTNEFAEADLGEPGSVCGACCEERTAGSMRV